MLLQKQRSICIEVYVIQSSGPLSDSTVLDETWVLARASNKPLYAFALLWTSYSLSFGDSDSGHNKPYWSHGPQPCLTQWNCEPCRVGPPKTDGSWWKFLTEPGTLEKTMPNLFSILALRTPWRVWKGKKIWHWKMNSAGQSVPNMLLDKSGEKTPERMKRQTQSKNNAHL